MLHLTYRCKLAIQVRNFTILLFIFFELTAFAQKISMTPNQGQWDERIDFSVPIQSGKLYIENDGLTFWLYEHADPHEGKINPSQTAYQGIFQKFVNCHTTQPKTRGKASEHYSNFLIGSDSSKWKHHVYDYQEVVYEELYTGIDLFYSSTKDQLSYCFKVYPNGQAAQIKLKIEGANAVYIDPNGNLVMDHRFGQITQSKLIAWAFVDGKRQDVAIRFEKSEGIVGLHFPDKLPKFDSLFIDPNLTFSTFTGSSADNWGFTATPDVAGNLYGAGIVFGYGYPTTAGAYDLTYNNGEGIPFDVGITKFNATGTNLLYSTYLGGAGNETPHSIICGTNGELYIYGVTSSPNFPISPGAYDATFNGGPAEMENSLSFSGSDIYVAKISTNGATLLASTYLGGSGTDGLNINTLHYNYGDQFRGEIILDANNNIYIASTTASSNFPVTSATTLNGSQDAVICKFSNNLNTLLWSTYFGGSGQDSGNSIEISPAGFVYATGGTTSSSLPGIFSGNDLSFNGGISDGYLIKLNPANGSLSEGTFMGMGEYDQSYFVRCDPSNQVYVYGQTESNWGITPGCTGTPNSGQFLRKYDPNLQTIQWTTTIGAGSGHVEISPTAFLISDCYEIYIAGWGGTLNANSSVSQALNSSSNGFPISPNAFQNNTNGSNFYLAVYSPDAQQLKYGTYMGGLTSSSNHVDGGTSRFDKSGRIYHAVCGACGGNDFGFTSTPGSWSPQNPSPNCNMAVFKFDLSTLDAIFAQPSPLICIPQPVVFTNTSVNGNSYYWDFGDNTNSTAFQPNHYYTSPGIYTVTLIVSDSANCYIPDTAVIQVNIGDFEGGVTIPPNPICSGSPYQLDAFGGSTYTWSPANLLDNSNIANPTATIYTNTVFTVIVSDSCGSDTLQVPLNVVSLNLTLSPDTSICIGESAALNAIGNGTIQWTPSTFLNIATGPNVISTPDTSTNYIAVLTSPEGCTIQDTVSVNVYFTPPSSNLQDTLIICLGNSATLSVSGANTYLWSPNVSISTTVGPIVTLSPTQNMYYYCTFTNACGSIVDSVYINLLVANITAGNDTVICPNQIANLWANGALYYQWSPSQFVVNQTGNQVWVSPTNSTLFQVIGTDVNGCKDTAFVEVVLHPQPFIQMNPVVLAFYGDLIQLNAVTNQPGVFTWSPPEFLSCINCSNPIANPDQDITYFVNFVDENGCIAENLVSITYEAVIYVPNTFIPDGNGTNDLFGVYGGNISGMKMLIFDRWGELIHTLNSTSEFWDGTYNGNSCQDGTYTWRLFYSDKQDKKYELTGHVNLIR